MAMADGASFVSTRGTQFVVDGHAFYVHGFNAYFLMAISVDLPSRAKASALLHDAAASGLSVCRTWAFSDGPRYHSLQPSPGAYDPHVFEALDFVLSEARRTGIRLILSFCNNWHDYGGKAQYVQWGRDAGLPLLLSEDSFFTDPTVKQLYKNHVKTILTRINTITGVAYKDDPTVFSWELMNEPQCDSDPSGNALQAWIEEMAAYVKSIDPKHLLEVGVEGFYGPSSPSRIFANPNFYCERLGTDFLSNHQVAGIDYASVHAYPDAWLGNDASIEQQINFMKKWLQAHLEDCSSGKLHMPMLLAEFGISDKNAGYTASKRQSLMAATYESLLESWCRGEAGAGALVWQLFPEGMEEWSDGYQIVLCKQDAAAKLVKNHSCKVADFNAAAKAEV